MRMAAAAEATTQEQTTKRGSFAMTGQSRPSRGAVLRCSVLPFLCLLWLQQAKAFAPPSSGRHEGMRSTPLSSSRGTGPRRAQQEDYWQQYDKDDEDDYVPPFRERYDSRAEEELRSMREENDVLYEDDEDVRGLSRLDRPLARNQRRAEEEQDDFYDGPQEEDPVMGNFWSNPDASLDPSPLAGRPRRTRDSQRGGLPRSKRKRTTFRSGIPEPPPPVKDLYDRLFWYGFDPAGDDSPADKTMFGGTKGKFNGLAYLNDGGRRMPPEQRRRRPRDPLDEEDYYSDMEDGEQPEDLTDGSGDDKMHYRSVTPPYDAPRPMPSEPTTVPPRERSRRQRRRDPRSYKENDREDSISNRLSSWFGDDSVDDDPIEENFRGRRSRRDNGTADRPFNPLDVFFGVNRQSLSRRADLYNQQMGIDERSPRRQRSPQRPGKSGYAYRYEAEEEDDVLDIPPISDYETVIEEDIASNTGALQPTQKPPAEPLRKLTWEERSMAIERVPPANIPAWGPSGDLGVDARSHAISNAMQDVLEAKRKVQVKETKVDKSREELSILRVDTELERKRLGQMREESRRLQQSIRELDLDVEDAARAFRYAQLQLQTAKEELADVEARHWGVLNFYNSDQAESGIDEAFRELEEIEPAARRYREKLNEEQL
jgi:hypothetical protein